MNNPTCRPSSDSFTSGDGGNRRSFESPPVRSPFGGGDFRRMSAASTGGGFRPMSAEGPRGYGFDNHQMPPLSGQKRGFPSARRGGSPDHVDGGTFAKVFVGSVPRTATEEDIRPVFEDYGNVIEVVLIKDKKTGEQRGCCFIKYSTPEEADGAIRALHNNFTLPGGTGPIQVRYADGERERLGAVEYKLFVGSLNKQATEKEIQEMFSIYGRVDDVYLMRDEKKQSRGCGFVKYSHKDMALAAINALNGIYTMRGCDQPLTVRFADPKRPRQGDSRDAPAFGGPGFGPRCQGPVPRPSSNFGDPPSNHTPPPDPSHPWHPMCPPNLLSSSNANTQGCGAQMLAKSGDMVSPMKLGGPVRSLGGSADSPFQASAVSSSMSQPMARIPAPQISPPQKPLQSFQNFTPSYQLYPQSSMPYPHLQRSSLSLQQHGPSKVPHTAGQAPLSQAVPSQQFLGFSGQLSSSQPKIAESSSSSTMPPIPNQQLATPVLQQLLQPQQSPSQLAQMLSQQTQTLQASFHSSQQAFSQLQQQLQQMQPSNKGLGSTSQQNPETNSKQSQQAGVIPQIEASSSGAAPTADVSSSAAVTAINQAMPPVKCNWTEHTSPDGFKYYYNSLTGESQWEKPDEFELYGHQNQQTPPSQQPQSQSHPQVLSAQRSLQMQQVHLQGQLHAQVHQQQQLRQPSIPTAASQVVNQQNVQEAGYTHVQAAVNPVSNPLRFSQSLHAGQEWMWKAKPTGV